jgi:hypothetical protein
MRKKVLSGLTPLLLCAAFTAGTPAIAQAETENSAKEISLAYAGEHWGKKPRLKACANTGLNIPERVQWECDGYFEGQSGLYWLVGTGPYGTVLEAYTY